METNSKILHELKEICPQLVQIHKRNPYNIPSGYFYNLSNEIAEKIKSGAEPCWYFSKENPYATPADYFEALPATIVQKIKREETKSTVFEEMEEISPLLNTISKKLVYTVPAGYLDTANWNKNETKAKKAKLISFTNVSKAVRYVRYIAAAVIIGLLAIGIFLFTGKQSTQTTNLKAAPELNQLSEQEIVDFLKTTSPSENIVSTSNSNSTKENDIKSSVSKMSDNEIRQFLQENGEQVEM